MATYDEIKSGLDTISLEITKSRMLFARARESLLNAKTILGAMPNKWSILANEIDVAAIANPNDDNYQLAKGEKDKLSENFQDLSAYVDNLISAHDGVIE